MRTLPILDAKGAIDPCTVGIVQASMQFPDDADSMEEDIEAYRMRARTGFRRTGLGTHLEATWRSARLGGMCAGSMLFTMVMFEKHRPELHVGMNKSAVATALYLQKEGPPFDKNESTIKKYWAQYKNSAHLWAALMIEWKRNGSSFDPPLDFLSLLDAAEQLVALAGPQISGWSPWRCPLGVITEQRPIVIPQPDLEDIALVKKYRADGKYLSR